MSWGPTLDKLIMRGSLVSGVVVNVYDVFSDVMVIWGFGYCGQWSWMWTALGILVAAQLFAAWEFAKEAPRENRDLRIKRFLIAMFQAHFIFNAYESWHKGRITPGFARHKFIESIAESAPQGIFSIYVLYYQHQRYNYWLIASILGSVASLAWGISVWLDFSLNVQIQADIDAAAADAPGASPFVPARAPASSPGLPTKTPDASPMAPSLVPARVPGDVFTARWFHHALWCSYFTVDFSLRLLTV